MVRLLVGTMVEVGRGRIPIDDFKKMIKCNRTNFCSVRAPAKGLFLNKVYDTTKNKLCYCNFSLNTNSKRKLIYERLKNKNFIEFEHIGKWQSYTGNLLWPEKKRLENLEVDLKCRDDFYKKLVVAYLEQKFCRFHLLNNNQEIQ